MAMTHEITELLVEWRRGDQDAFDALFPLVYEEMRRRAHAYLREEREDHTLSPTALVHEAYLKLVDIERVDWQDRSHFFAMAARAMRRVLVSHARKHKAVKRGSGVIPLTLDEAPTLSTRRSEEMLALDDALDRLAALDERMAQVVELRFFGGLTIEETGEVLGVAPSTVKLDWRKARAWLYRDLGEAAEPVAEGT